MPISENSLVVLKSEPAFKGTVLEVRKDKLGVMHAMVKWDSFLIGQIEYPFNLLREVGTLHKDKI